MSADLQYLSFLHDFPLFFFCSFELLLNCLAPCYTLIFGGGGTENIELPANKFGL